MIRPVFVRSCGDCKRARPGLELAAWSWRHKQYWAAGVRGIIWLGSATAALLIVLAATIGWRGTAPPKSPASATSALPAPAAPAEPPSVDIARPSFDIVRVDPQGQAVIAGRALPGDRVRVLEGGKPVGEVTADARGDWVLVLDAPLAPGNRQLALEATSKEGGPVRRSDDVVALSVTPPAAAGGSPSTLAVLLPGDANQPARVLQQPTLPPHGQELSLDTAEYGAPNRLMLSGHADPASRLNIYAGDRLLGTVTADPAGKWSLTAPYREPTGGVELRLDELAADGTVAYRIAVPLEAPAASAVAQSGGYVVRRGNSLWVIARQLYGEGLRFTAIYSANRDQIRDPNRIYPGQTFKLPKS
jgi:LysM domain